MNTTRRYPRTLQEAFGPHTSTCIDDGSGLFDREDRLVVWACALAAAVLVVVLIAERLA